MKKIIKVLSLVLIFIMCFGIINAFAKGKTLSNDKFYAEIPTNFSFCDDYGDDHYYFEGQSSIDYQETYTTTINNIEIYVEGNILFPDGIKETDIGIIKDRFSKFILVEDGAELDIKKAEKGNINGITACYIYGITDDGLSEEFFHSYILTTKENLYIVTTSNYLDAYKEEPEFLKEFMSNFLVNGTYFKGDKLTKSHDFSKAEKYIDALERDVFTEEFYTYHSGTATLGLAIVSICICFPIAVIVLLVLYIKTRKKLKEYKEFFGTIEDGKMALRQHYMQNSSYQPMQNNGGYYTNVPNMYGYNGNQPPVAQPQYQPQYQPTQPVQKNLPPEMQENPISNENNL